MSICVSIAFQENIYHQINSHQGGWSHDKASSLPLLLVSVPLWSRIIFQKPISIWLVEKLPTFMEPKGSLPYSQEATFGPYPDYLTHSVSLIWQCWYLVKNASYEASHYAFHHPVTSSPFDSSTLLSILFSNTFIEYTTKILSTGSSLIRTHLDKNFSIRESDGHSIAQTVGHWDFAAVTDRFSPRAGFSSSTSVLHCHNSKNTLYLSLIQGHAVA